MRWTERELGNGLHDECDPGRKMIASRRDYVVGPKKPTGRAGPIHISTGPPRREIIEWPDNKKEIECIVAAMFVDHAGRMPMALLHNVARA